jgi:enterochelin esterase-like enzyme
MERIGGRSRALGLGSLIGLLLISVLLAGCSGASGQARKKDPPPATHPAARDPFPGLPGQEMTKGRDAGGDLRRVHYYSRALGRSDSYLIYLPPGYRSDVRSGMRFPVLYLLHGDGRHQRHGAGHLFQRGRVGPAATSLIRSGRIRPMLIVVPESTDGTVVGDNEWANTARGRFASNVLDVVHSVDSTWPTVATRSARAIGGLSMGGYGAVNIALHRLDLFSTVESWSGYYTQKPTGVFAGASKATLQDNSPAWYVDRVAPQLRANPIHVLLYISRTDPLRFQQTAFAAKLHALGIPVESFLFGGPHNFALWSNHMNLALTFANHWLSTSGAPAT